MPYEYQTTANGNFMVIAHFYDYIIKNKVRICYFLMQTVVLILIVFIHHAKSIIIHHLKIGSPLDQVENYVI